MKLASELYKISQTKAPEIVADIMHGVKEHVEKRCEEKANKGATNYTIYLKEGLSFTKSLLLKECVSLAKEFEDNGYKVSIEDSGNGYYLNFIITFSWDGRVSITHSSFNNKNLLYTTDRGIIKK